MLVQNTQIDKYWLWILFCSEHRCPSPKRIDKAHILMEDTNNGSDVNYACTEFAHTFGNGYKEFNMQCVNSMWNHPDIMTEEMHCSRKVT